MTDRDVAEPLAQNTRRERTWLLVANAVLFAMVQAGLLPEKIEALGLTSSAIQPKALVLLVEMIVAYLGCAFVVSAWADFTAWKAALSFLRDRKVARACYYRDQIRPSVQADMSECNSILGAEEVARIVREVSEKTFSQWDRTMERGWAKFSKAYRIRAIYETVVPAVLTVANLVGSIPFLIRG